MPASAHDALFAGAAAVSGLRPARMGARASRSHGRTMRTIPTPGVERRASVRYPAPQQRAGRSPYSAGARASCPHGCAGVPLAWVHGHLARMGARASCLHGCAGILPAWVRGRPARMGARASRPHGCAGILPAWVHGHLARMGARVSCPHGHTMRTTPAPGFERRASVRYPAPQLHV